MVSFNRLKSRVTQHQRPKLSAKLLIGVCIAVVGALVTVSSQSYADVIIDPDGIGATNAFDFGNRLIIGFRGEGTFEVNSENNVNGTTSVNFTDFIEIGNLDQNSDGELRVIGDGTAGSARVTGTAGLRVGSASNGIVKIENGGSIEGSSVLSGFFSPSIGGNGNTAIEVTGNNSKLTIAGPQIGIGLLGGRSDTDVGADSLTVSNGASVAVAPVLGTVATDPDQVGSRGFDGSLNVGGRATGGHNFTDRITVTGPGSSIEHASGFFFNGGNAVVEVLNGGQIVQSESGTLIDDQAALIENSQFSNFENLTAEEIANRRGINVTTAFSDGLLRVSGSDGNGNVSTVSTTRDLNIGGGESFVGVDGNGVAVENPNSGSVVVENGARVEVGNNVNVSQKGSSGTGSLTVSSGGFVSAKTINVFDGGVLNGDGGSIFADVIVDGGTVSPGNSPGTMFIDGDLILNTGLLEIELDSPSLTDFLDVTGDVFFGENLIVQLILGFVPTDVIELSNFFNFGSFEIDPGFDLLSNLDLVFTPDADLTDGDIVTVSLFDRIQDFSVAETTPVPEPGTLALLLFGIGGLACAKRRRRAA